MNLAELYAETPVVRHKDIKVVGDRVFVKDAGGDIAEYLIVEDSELWLANSDKALRVDVEAIRNKLGA